MRASLNQVAEGKRLDSGDLSVASRRLAKVASLGELWRTLEVDLVSSLGSLCLGGFVVLDALQDLLLALGFSHVLDADVNALLDDSAIDQLVDTHSDGGLGDVEDDSSASVVALVRHTLVHGGIREDVDVVAHLDVEQVLREVDRAVLPKLLREHVARARSDTVRVGHVLVGSWVIERGRDFWSQHNDERGLLVSSIAMLLAVVQSSDNLK